MRRVVGVLVGVTLFYLALFTLLFRLIGVPSTGALGVVKGAAAWVFTVGFVLMLIGLAANWLILAGGLSSTAGGLSAVAVIAFVGLGQAVMAGAVLILAAALMALALWVGSYCADSRKLQDAPVLTTLLVQAGLVFWLIYWLV